MSNSIANLFNLKVLLRYDSKYAVHVAHCIETGSLVTADSADEAQKMIQELLEDEILFALRHRNLKNLFSSPAPYDVLIQWINASRESKPTIVFLDINLKEVENHEIEPTNAGLKNRIEFVQAA